MWISIFLNTIEEVVPFPLCICTPPPTHTHARELGQAVLELKWSLGCPQTCYHPSLASAMQGLSTCTIALNAHVYSYCPCKVS